MQNNTQQQYALLIQPLSKKKSITVNIHKYFIKRKSFRAHSDFNSQLLSNQNSQDFNIIANTIKKSQSTPTSEMSQSNSQKNIFKKDRKTSIGKAPLQILRYPNIKTYHSLIKTNKQRHATQYQLYYSPVRKEGKKNFSAQNIVQQFEKYQKTHKIKLSIKKMLPEMIQKKIQRPIQNSNFSLEIIKPWQTKRDLFHETFKKYMAENKRYRKWIKGINPISVS